MHIKFSAKATLPTLLLFLLLVSLRIPSLQNPPVEYHAWRQSDTEAIARNFFEQRLNIFYPQLNYDGPLPNYVQLELQITTFLIALAYKAFGPSYFAARVVPLFFFVGSAYFFYLLVKKQYSYTTAWLATLIYGLFPINLFFSRAIMPESAALFFSLGGFYYFTEWTDNQSRANFLWATLFTALAITQKIPAVFLGLPMLVQLLAKRGRSILRTPLPWLYCCLTLGLPFVYFLTSHYLADTAFVTGIAREQILSGFASAVFSAEARNFFAVYLPRSFTGWGLALASPGLLIFTKSFDKTLLVWTLALFLELITIVAVVRLEYYLIFLGPVLALLVGKTLHFLKTWPGGKILVLLVLILFFRQSWTEIAPYFQIDGDLLQQAAFVQHFTEPTELVVISSAEPQLLNISRRQGWRANTVFAGQPDRELHYFMEHGASYFLLLANNIYLDTDTRYRSYLDTNFPSFTHGTMKIYFLKTKEPPFID